MDKSKINLTELINQAHNYAIRIDAYRRGAEFEIFSKLLSESIEFGHATNESYYADISEFDIDQKEDYKKRFEERIKNSVGDELADIILVCLSASEELGIDIEKHLLAKNEYNKVR